jgi:hypothetical protein
MAQLEDADGEPVEQAGVPVSFSVSQGALAPSTTALTDGAGTAKVSWTVSARGIWQAQAAAPGLQPAWAAAVFTNSPAAIRLMVNPPAIPADGKSMTSIVARLVDDAADPLHGLTVGWQPEAVSLAASPLGLVDIVGENPQLTVQGEARWTAIARTTPGVVTLTASATGLQSDQEMVTLARFRLSLPANASGAPGQQIALSISIVGVGGLAGLQATITFPEAALTVVAVEKGSLVSSRTDWALSYTSAPGSVTFLLASLALNPLEQASGEIARLILRMSPSAQIGTTVPVAFKSAKCVNVSGATIPSETVNGLVAITSPTQTFQDVPPTSPLYPYVEAIVRAGITSGCATSPSLLYCPNGTVTRGQMAKFLCKAAGKTWLYKPTLTFTDVPRWHVFYGWIERLADADSWGGSPPTSGCTLTTFCPNQTVTRGQMAKFLCKAVGKTWLANPTPTFADVPTTHTFYAWVERLADPTSWGGAPVTDGCQAGTPRLYCPTWPVTRGQMAVLLCRAFGLH